MALVNIDYNAVKVAISDCPDTGMERQVTVTHLIWNTGERRVEISTIVEWLVTSPDGTSVKVIKAESVNLQATDQYYVDMEGNVIGAVEGFDHESHAASDYMLEYDYYVMIAHNVPSKIADLQTQAVLAAVESGKYDIQQAV